MDRRPSAPPVVLVLAFAVPLATLVAGGWTLAVAGSGGLHTVGETVRRTAQVQQTDLGPDLEAARRRLAGELRLVTGQARFQAARIPPAGTVDASTWAVADELTLHLEHPIDAGHDRTIVLARDGDGWRGPGFDAAVGWRVALAPPDGRWRLVGRWPRAGAALALRPALEPAAAPAAAGAAREAGDARR